MRLVTRWQISYTRGTQYTVSSRLYTYAEARQRVERLKALGNDAEVHALLTQAPLARGTKNG